MTQVSYNEDEKAIRELIDRWAQAVRDRELSGIRADHDPDILMFDVPPPLAIRGLEAYMKTWETFFDWSVRPVRFDFHDIEVTAGSEAAFATAIGRCRGKEKNGEVIDLEFRLTMGLRKNEGGWTIVHEHHSLPATN